MIGGPHVAMTTSEGIGWVTLRNPDRRNAITQHMAEQLVAHCAAIRDDPSIAAAVVDAEGAFFCSGADTRDLATVSAAPATEESVRLLTTVYEGFTAVRRLPVPTISLVAGGAVGAGLNLMLSTDLTIAAPDATFDSGFVARSIHPGGGHIALLSRRLRSQDALAMVNLGWRLDARTAESVGLVWRVVEHAEHREVASELLALAVQDAALSRRIRQSISLEVGADAVTDRGVEIERGSQMWSLGRLGEAGWTR